MKINLKQPGRIKIVIIVLYLVFNLYSLGFFPFAHSDEGWLASLSRTMIKEKSLTATEDFFHLTVRHPHAVKSLYHVMQFPFVAASDTLFSVRLLSLAAGLTALFLLFRASRFFVGNTSLAWVVTLLTAVDSEFLYSAHFGRQEIIVAAVFCAGLFLFIRPKKYWYYKHDLVLGGILAAAEGIHPNIFVISSAITFLYLAAAELRKITGEKKYPSFKNLGLFLAVLAAGALIYTGISILMDPGFVAHYLAFGSQTGVTDPLIIKLLKLPRFYSKMFYRISGTYFLPDVRPQLILFGIISVMLIPAAFIRNTLKHEAVCLTALNFGVNLGLLVIGKYSPPSLVFMFIPGYLSVALFLKIIFSDKKILFYLAGFMICASFIFSLYQILPWRTQSYSRYIQRIKTETDGDGPVLANLNTVFAFNPGKLFTYRDLNSLKESMSFSSFVKQYRIRYIILPEELQIIFNERPVWNSMYGNIYPWYPEMISFIEAECEKIAQWAEPVYGMRITTYMGRKEGTITVYRVKER